MKILLVAFLNMVLIGFPSIVFGNDQIGLTLGAGLPEFINIGLRYQTEKIQLGVS